MGDDCVFCQDGSGVGGRKWVYFEERQGSLMNLLWNLDKERGQDSKVFSAFAGRDGIFRFGGLYSIFRLLILSVSIRVIPG